MLLVQHPSSTLLPLLSSSAPLSHRLYSFLSDLLTLPPTTENGIKGLFRGVTPRIGLGVWRVCYGIPPPNLDTELIPDCHSQTICLVSLGDYIKDAVNSREKIITATDY